MVAPVEQLEPEPEPDAPIMFIALEKQLGLKLESTKGPHGFLVIDHIERPSPNSGPAILEPLAQGEDFADLRHAIEQSCNVCSTWIGRVLPVTPALHGHDFWRREGGRLVATPLFVALAVIETTDVVFALDSVPAVLSVSRDPLIVMRPSEVASEQTTRWVKGESGEVW